MLNQIASEIKDLKIELSRTNHQIDCLQNLLLQETLSAHERLDLYLLSLDRMALEAELENYKSFS